VRYGRAMPKIINEAQIDVSLLQAELEAVPQQVGTSLWFENDRVRVWEIRLGPGEGCSFHAHVRPYLWTCVIGGTGRQRSSDGIVRVIDYAEGDTHFAEPSDREPLVHDLENIGQTTLRFVTVELLG
jgi:beta-alanine degradation protein BauB